MNSLVAELVKVTGKERILLEQCKDFLSTLAAMQVSEAVWQNHSKTRFKKIIYLFIFSLLLIFIHRHHNHPNDRSRIVA